jgi:hypothetical protein
MFIFRFGGISDATAPSRLPYTTTMLQQGTDASIRQPQEHEDRRHQGITGCKSSSAALDIIEMSSSNGPMRRRFSFHAYICARPNSALILFAGISSVCRYC